MKKINVLVVDDHTLFRKGLVNIINQIDNIEVIAEAADGLEALQIVNQELPIDVILLDVNMPKLNGIETLKRLSKRGHQIPVIMVSMEDNELRIIQLIRLGAKGYILKEAHPDELKLAIQTVYRNEFFFNSVVSQQLIDEMDFKKVEIGLPIQKLTERELEFLSLVCTDLTYKEIATKMDVSIRTVDGYREELFFKLNLKSRVGIAVFAIKSGIVSIET